AALGVAPADAAGTVDGRVQLALPLDRVPDVRQLGLDVHAQLQHVGLRSIGPGWPLADGDLTLSVARPELTMSGRVRLAGAPVNVSLRQALGAASARRHLDATGRVNRTERAALGFDLGPGVDGPIGVRANLDQSADGSGRLRVSLDLHEMRL